MKASLAAYNAAAPFSSSHQPQNSLTLLAVIPARLQTGKIMSTSLIFQ
jgi:hypothetical protein